MKKILHLILVCWVNGILLTARGADAYGTDYTFTTLAGEVGTWGSADGPGSAARFTLPYGVAVDSSGNVYVADSANNTIRRSGTLAYLLALALDTTNLVWATGGNASWLATTLGAHDGVDVARSGTIAHSQESWMETTVTGPGIVTFQWRVSSQGGSDFLRFYVGGIEQSNLSGESGWQPQAFAVSTGVQRLRWQ